MTCRAEYESRLQNRETTLVELCQCDDRAVHLRTAVFAAGVLCAWAVFGRWQLPWWVLLVPVALFVGAVIYHVSVQRRKRSAERAIEHYRRCLDRLEGNWTATQPDGAEFLDPLHPASGDLDLFGPGSLLQLLNSPVTPAGLRTLASWLAPPADEPMPAATTVRQRQNAVRGLRDELDLRERLAVIGHSELPADNAEQLHRWLAKPEGMTAGWIRLVAAVLGILGSAALVYWLTTGHLAALIAMVLVQMLFLRPFHKTVASIKQRSAQAVVELGRIEQVVAALEEIQSQEPELVRLRDQLVRDGEPASETIHRLQRIAGQYENMRHNIVIAPLAFISMVSTQFACAIDRWRLHHGGKVEAWFQAVGELEALLAFAQLHCEQPNYSFPEFVDGPPQLVANDIAHPLLPPGTAVANDVALSDECRMLLISGSNMSGKSTLMRSVGVNTSLAWAGAPVYAKSLSLSRLRVAAAMRVQDSLLTGTSYFYAELKRIRQVVELAESELPNAAPVLFLLDEVLHGTNSHDRLVGGRAIIRSLLDAGAIGLVTTHDLALSEMIGELDVPARNVHFCDDWVDGKMTFDYRMRPGVVPKGNALSLMRLLGLDV